jgi:adenine-specific DNA-methyltransferase
METTSICTSNDNPKKKIIVKRKVKGIVLPTRKEPPSPKPDTQKLDTQKPDTPKPDKNTDDFVLQTMLTCIGNKRLLVDNIFDIVKDVAKTLGKDKMNIMDGFSGSAVVSRKLSNISSTIYSNDLETYAYIIAKSSLETPCETDRKCVATHIENMNKLAFDPQLPGDGFISRLYAPQDTENIQQGERCFYTQENARIIHAMRNYIDDPNTAVPMHLRVHLIAPLLAKASIHANTSGVFKGFHSANGVGAWGGAGAKCLPRIKGTIQLDMPIWNLDYEGQFTSIITQGDINKTIANINDGELDLLYLDPPYNQHPYGSNYFMLNLIAENKEPDDNTLSRVSGIPNTWNRSNYNYKKSAIDDMTSLLDVGTKKSTYILLSYNNEGIIGDHDWENILSPYTVEKIEIKYNAYRGSRNLAGRTDKVMERLYLIRKK